jgi:hypothetical protein
MPDEIMQGPPQGDSIEMSALQDVPEQPQDDSAIQQVIAPKPIKLSAERESELITEVTRNYGTFVTSEWFTRRKKDWDEFHKMYVSKLDEKNFPWTDSSNCDLGIVEMCVDNIKARYKISTIGAKPMFNAVPVTPEGEQVRTQVADSMNYILENDFQIENKIDLITQNTAEYGTCITKLYWKRDLKETKEWNNIDGIVYPSERSDTEERGCVDVIDLVDIMVPEGAGADIHEIPWMYQRLWYSVYDLHKKVKIGFFSQDKVDIVEGSLQVQKTQSAKTSEERLRIIHNLPEEKVEILECYMRFDADGDGIEEECVFWICPATNTYMKGFYLRDLYFNNIRPFYRFAYKETGGFYGRGIPEMLKPYRKLINDLFNFSINCLMLQILPWGFYRIGSSFKPEEVRLAPGVMIPVDDINDVKIAQFPASAQVVEGVVMLIMSFIERQTGISAPQMGKEFPTRKTATEVKTILSEGNVKHEDRIQTFQEQFSELLRGVYNLYRQNQSGERTGRVTEGEDYRFVKLFSAFDKLPDYDFIILGTLTTGNKAVEREDAMGLYSVSMQNPIMQNWLPGQLEWLKELYTTFGKRNVARFLPPDQLIQQMNQMNLQGMMQKLQAASMGQQPQGGPGGPGGPPQPGSGAPVAPPQQPGGPR